MLKLIFRDNSSCFTLISKKILLVPEVFLELCLEHCYRKKRSCIVICIYAFIYTNEILTNTNIQSSKCNNIPFLFLNSIDFRVFCQQSILEQKFKVFFSNFESK